MKRLLSTKALWHQWRALKLARRAAYVAVNASARARLLLDASEAHAAEAAISLLASRSLARGPLPEPTETDQPGGCRQKRTKFEFAAGLEEQPAGCSFAGRMLLGSIVGLAICTIWIWIVARAGR